MKQFVGITASDGLNRKRHYFSFSVLETMYHENWSNIFPVGLNHDRTKTIGAGRLDGIYFEPGKAYVTNRTYIAENITDRQKFKSEFDLWVYRQYIEPRKEELKELEGMLEGLLSTEKTVAPIAAVAFKDKGIVLRVFPKLKDLIDDDGLINLSNLAPILPGVYKKDGFLLFASSYLRRNCYIGNSLNSEFLNCLQALRNENDSLSVKIRLDFDLIGLYGTQQQELEYSYWWGPKFTEDIEDIDLGVTRHSNDNYDNFFSNLVFTEFGWYYQDGNKTLEIEEVIDSINIISEEQELIGCRYIHSYINPETSQPKHLDGAIRAYTEDKILMRMDTSLDKTERDTVYTKLWRIDGDIPVARWKEIITHYYRDNILIGEYFHGVDKSPEFSKRFGTFFKLLDLVRNSVKLLHKRHPLAERCDALGFRLLGSHAILGKNIHCLACQLHVGAVDAVTDKFVFLRLHRHTDNSCFRLVLHSIFVVDNTAFDLLRFVKPPKCFCPRHFGSRIALFLLCKHKFQVYRMLWIVVDKYAAFGAFQQKICKVIARLYDLIYREFQLCLPR